MSSEKIRRGELRRRLPEARGRRPEVGDRPFYIDDTPAIAVSTLRTRARRLKRQQEGLSMIIVDYLQLMRPSVGQRTDNRVQEISNITQGLKAIARS